MKRMTLWRLIIKSLQHFRAVNSALVAGVAVATAVLTGSLMVGDSVRGSLHDLAVKRLGPVEQAIVTTSLFDESLATRLNADEAFRSNYGVAHAGLSLRGRAATPDGRNAAAGVQLMAVNLPEAAVPAGAAVINAATSDALGTVKGPVNFTLPLVGDVPRDAALARRGRADVLAVVQASVNRVEREPGFLSLFSLTPSQREPRNAWLNLADLQQAVEQRGRANMLLFTAPAGNVRVSQNKYLRLTSNSIEGMRLDEAIKEHLKLNDYGLAMAPVAGGKQVALTSRSTYIRQSVVEALPADVRRSHFATHLFNKVEHASGNVIHYVMATGTDADLGATLRPSEAAINQWTAQQLGAKVGDSLAFRYYVRATNGQLEERSGPSLRIVAVLPMTGLGADRTLTPDYAGFTDADTVADWSPPEGFAFDKKLVTKADEDYWRDHRAAPKVFINLQTAAALYGTPLGHVTSVRFAAADRDQVERALLTGLRPADFGFVAQPVRAQQLAAAEGSTDFSGLFIGFSFFLICAAVALLVLLFRLSLEQRLRHIGLLTAVGFSPKRVFYVFAGEAALLSGLGVVIGLALAVAYTHAVMWALTTWWIAAVGTTHLHAWISASTLTTGGCVSFCVGLITMIVSARMFVRQQPIALLSGAMATKQTTLAQARRWLAPLVGVAVVIVFGGLIYAGLLQAALGAAVMGFAVLVAGLKVATDMLRPRRGHAVASMWSLARRNAGSRVNRARLAMSLIAFASFILILVASMKQLPPADAAVKPSGTGGYRLILTADVPLLGDLNTHEGRRTLGIRAGDAAFADVRFTHLRSWQGQDISCLNMTKPTQPTILSAPAGLRERFVHTTQAGVPGTIDAVADAETAQYILKVPAGGTMALTDQTGRPATLALTTLLKGSMFQSELLISEDDFVRLFPLQSGFGVVLIECPPDRAADVARLLERELDEFSVTVEPTTARLARFKEVANTYLATFQSLGGLGLLLGTVGLAVVLLRSTLERRGEFGLMLAVGFSRARIARVVFVENAVLLLAGLAIGCVAAVIAVAPAARALHVPSLALMFGLIAATGAVALAAATWVAMRGIQPASLRAE